RRFEGVTLGNLANLYVDAKRFNEAEQAYERSRSIHADVGNTRYEGVTLCNLGMLYRDTNRLEQGKRAFVAALAIHRAVGDRYFEGLNLCNYACLLVADGGAPAAQKAWQQGETILRELGAGEELAAVAVTLREACNKAGISPLDVSVDDVADDE
ncbi:MAG: tetratricopeptide repeat protein, partial [Planctomycetes bacterium]|nr:tetratricopeptide repeat protein [Planctomycetota bacterium]